MADIQRYINLITSQHQNKPKFTAWLTALLSKVDDITTLANNLYSYFDIENAVGAQLDIAGEIIGRSRVLSFQPTDGSSPILDDDTYRLVLKAKTAQNQWDGTIEQIYSIWNSLFPNSPMIIQDNQDMTMTVVLLGITTQLEKDLVVHGYIVPKPQGVTIGYVYMTDPLFSYGLDSTNFKGYGEGYWSQYL